MEETKKLSCIDCNVKKCNAKQNIENNKPYPGFCERPAEGAGYLSGR